LQIAFSLTLDYEEKKAGFNNLKKPFDFRRKKRSFFFIFDPIEFSRTYEAQQLVFPRNFEFGTFVGKTFFFSSFKST
jgi:hypothetical protein